ncbi:MAG TPA: hypothetical protein VNM24_01640 [Burkholderiales bacterium]|nr:hypothetical protein [Burkholderiales bacterium]
MDKLALSGPLCAVLLAAGSALAECRVSDFEIRITKAQWVDECRRRSCPIMKGAAVLTNKCAVAASPQVRIVGLNKAGDPIAVHEAWPFGASNIAPGAHPFSLDQWLDYDPEIARFQAEVVRITTW